MKDKPLTAKQQRFCEQYQIDLNATQAAIRAGYGANSVNAFRVIGCHNLMKANVKAELARLRADITEKIGLTAQYVLDKLKKIAEATEHSNPTVSVRALELLGKHKGIFELDNAQKASEVRIYTYNELKAELADNDARDKEIEGITGGMAE